jgi:hypothetical protein
LIVLGCGCAGVIAGLCWCMVEEWFWGVGESIFILVVWGECITIAVQCSKCNGAGQSYIS